MYKNHQKLMGSVLPTLHPSFRKIHLVISLCNPADIAANKRTSENNLLGRGNNNVSISEL